MLADPRSDTTAEWDGAAPGSHQLLPVSPVPPVNWGHRTLPSACPAAGSGQVWPSTSRNLTGIPALVPRGKQRLWRAVMSAVCEPGQTD